jgi:4-diphosphocytidyl-2-C-methyl-D-erythritol kinase
MLQLFSPAKINLFLRVVSKRADGYHNLSSLFQAVTLGDTLTLAYASQDSFTCSNPHLLLDYTNLVVKARDLFRAKTGSKQAFSIHLHKRIPMQAGLGGGSSNAATVLWGCNQLMGGHLLDAQLSQWGADLGSDVPFFFSQGTAYCTGRGEEVQRVDGLASQQVWIVKPEEGLSTPEIFQQFQLKNPISADELSQDLPRFIQGNLSYFNDLEAAAFKVKPSLVMLKNQLLQHGFHTVLMSGSGSAFFCLGEATLPDQLPLTHFSVQYCRRSPLEWYQET